MPRSRKVFCSYSRADAPTVKKLVEIVRVTASHVFLDLDSISPGDDWASRLTAGLDTCDTVLLFWSATAARSEWVEQEWRHAITRAVRVVPVLLDATPLPPEVARFQWIDFRATQLLASQQVVPFYFRLALVCGGMAALVAVLWIIGGWLAIFIGGGILLVSLIIAAFCFGITSFAFSAGAHAEIDSRHRKRFYDLHELSRHIIHRLDEN